ncbi:MULTISPECIES: hypothetical protein [unclassified Iodidimonas]|uniref:hypothetical protein n=1 Tax=unclassified Iodidimonas TaxID=2626145 RepID=UPI0024830884|nr:MULTISPECIES: hypothetical protein [unclassified Iodidimonas]
MAAFLVIVNAQHAFSQEDMDPVDTIIYCGSLDNNDKKLACFDAAYHHYSQERMAQKADSPRAESFAHGKVVDGNAAEGKTPNGKISGGLASSPAKNTKPAQSIEQDGVRSQHAAKAAPSQAMAGNNRRKMIVREITVDDLELPLETTITAFNMNKRGDFKLQIAEGWIFARSDGPTPPNTDLTGASVVLEKNFLGNWRMSIPDMKKPLWIKPDERE